MVGDLNIHYPLWGGERGPRHDIEAEELLERIGENRMEVLVAPGTITIDERGGQTSINLMFDTPWV